MRYRISPDFPIYALSYSPDIIISSTILLHFRSLFLWILTSTLYPQSTIHNPSCSSSSIEMPVSAYDAFPPSEFNAWVESVRNKIIDGLDTLHDDLEEELARPGPSRQVQVELSENAKKAIRLARERQNVIAREAGQTDRSELLTCLMSRSRDLLVISIAMTSPLQEPPLSSHYHDHDNTSNSEQDEE
jgi:hypothetical protein